MNPVQLYRVSGTFLVLGGVVALIANAMIGVLFPDHNSLTAPLQPLYAPLNLASAIGVSLLLIGLPGWYARHASELGRSGLVGVVTVGVTLLLAGVFDGLYLAIVMPFAALHAPELVTEVPPLFLATLIFSVLAEIVGPAFLGWQLVRRCIGYRWSAWALLISAPVTLVWFASAVFDGETAPSPLTIVGNILSAGLLLVALGGFGAELLSDLAERRQPIAVRSAA